MYICILYYMNDIFDANMLLMQYEMKNSLYLICIASKVEISIIISFSINSFHTNYKLCYVIVLNHSISKQVHSKQ